MPTAPRNQTTPATEPAPPVEPAPAAVQTADRVAELEAENTRLRAENARLAEQLAAAGRPAGPARPVEPSFTFSEGQRAELETTGRTVSPYTGQRFVGTSAADAREATAAEFAKAKPPTRPAADRKR
ncbi:hypothetical protein [Micromonospora sp. HUAS LYJ1]|uniref:hypothetical protein n=1 Tax=Micromonospora sp. HUAS LYJ1 TaxID=3061626 RepID=UPI002671138A|nr:hypothetical protein [Micromonospora sp. HUAS LYJ1]WKU03852.1 hypothetical protein Q2K16_23880 [Micromonospora sp. HUAS LYJ1]